MKKQLHHEIQCLTVNSSFIGLWAVLAAFGGCLMWVHGSMAPWIFRTHRMPAGTPAFTVFFLLWLLLYGLQGTCMGVTVLYVKRQYHLSIQCLFGNVLIYILLLAWYPLFFSVLHCIMAVISLGCSVILQTFFLKKYLHYSKVSFFLCFLTILLEIYFLYVTIAFELAN